MKMSKCSSTSLQRKNNWQLFQKYYQKSRIRSLIRSHFHVFITKLGSFDTCMARLYNETVFRNGRKTLFSFSRSLFTTAKITPRGNRLHFDPRCDGIIGKWINTIQIEEIFWLIYRIKFRENNRRSTKNQCYTK